MENVENAVHDIARRAKTAALSLATAPRGIKDAVLNSMADAIIRDSDAIIAANAVDLDRERAGGMNDGLLDRLALNADRLKAIADAMREVASLPDPVGDMVRGSTLANGLKLLQVRVPMGVVGMIYEARPNVTADAAALALKSGNAVILRGGSAAASTNAVMVDTLRSALTDHDLPEDLVQTIDPLGREGGVALMKARGLVDVLIPRGGAGLISTVVNEAKVPVIETGVGNVHVFVDKRADLEIAKNIVMNSKTQRVGVCNAAETLLVHADVALPHLADVLPDLVAAGVTIHGDSTTVRSFPKLNIVPATEDDWAREYLSADLAVKVVKSFDEAVEHIRQYSTGHTEAIITKSLARSERFVNEVDSAAVIVNASTRFTDGGEFGLGAEIGISTQKLHARGPMGLAELTTTKWVVHGTGQIRG
jgi:glutamate-5-semialdehyde dehydrogenase